MNSKIGVNRYRLNTPEERQEAISRICQYLEDIGYKEWISYHCPRTDRDSDDGFFTTLKIDELKELKELSGIIDIETEKYFISLTNFSVSYFELKK